MEKQAGVERILDAKEKEAAGINHPRAGDLIAAADARSWFTYYCWLEDQRAPDFARCVDIHRKPGYDPVELFVDPALAFPKLKIAATLLRKKLGFRTLMNVIPLDASLVKGSHGRITAPAGFPLFVAQNSALKLPHVVEAVAIAGHLKSILAPTQAWAAQATSTPP